MLPSVEDGMEEAEEGVDKAELVVAVEVEGEELQSPL